MERHFSDHARDRALERYGLALTDAELEDIYRQCQSGRSLIGRRTHHGAIYLIRWKDGQLIFPVITGSGATLVTFMAKDYFQAGQNRQHYQKLGMAKQKSATARSARQEGYKRQRITLRQALDEL